MSHAGMTRDIPAAAFSDVAIPDLELIGQLGQGQVAEVFLAREAGLKRLVAVKVLRPAVAADPTARLRFEREAHAAAALTHPGVVQVYRVGETADGRPFLMMQHVKGRSLEERLAAEGPLAIDDVRRIIVEVAEALDAAHRRRIVHRDVKPSNVLQDEESGRVLLADFGLAALLDSAEGPVPKLTAVGQIVGDAHFMSPEQVKGERLTGQADVYQLGVLAYYLLTGKGPFGSLPTARLMAAHLKDAPLELTTLRHTVDPVLADLVQRCLAKEPGRRPTPADVIRKLRGAGAGQGGADGSGERPGLLRRRMPQFVAAGVVAGGALMGGVSQLTQHRILPEVMYPLALTLVIHGVAATAVLSWFHGEHGQQRVKPLEVAGLGLLGLSWIASSVWVVL